ncbi:hypothetical protein ACWD3J_41395 [Streptomyces sp. NPDC002755]|uniref:hypothetical protein n=1 Tax=Streptomyces sp. NPDC002884 TaxID=3154544 RepID=UPI0033286A12
MSAKPQAEGIALPVPDELEQVRGDLLPVADLRPACAAVQFIGERGQRHDLSRMAAGDETVVDAGTVRLPDTGVQQASCGHKRGVDLTGRGRIAGLVREAQVHLAGVLLGTVLGHVRFLLRRRDGRLVLG